MARLSVLAVVASCAVTMLLTTADAALQCEDEDVRAWKCHIPESDTEQRLITKQGWFSETSGRTFVASSKQVSAFPVDPFPTRFFAVDTRTGEVAWSVTGADAHAPPFHLFELVASHAMNDVVHLSTVQGKQLGLQAYTLADSPKPGDASVFKYATPCAADEVLCRFLVIGSALVPGSATSEQRMVLLHQKTDTGKISPSNWTNVELVGVKWEPANGYKQLWHLTIKTDGSTPNPHNAVFSPDAEVVNFYHNFGDFHGIVSTYDFSTGKALHAGSMYPFAPILGVQNLMMFPPPAGAPNKRDLYAIAQSFDLTKTYYFVQRNSTYGVHGVQYQSGAITLAYANYGFKEDGSRLLTFAGNNLCNSTTPGGLLSGGDGTLCTRLDTSYGLDTDLYASAFHPSMTKAWAFPIDQILTLQDNKVTAKSDLLFSAQTQSAFYVSSTDTVVFAAQTFHTLMGYKGTCVPGSGSHNPSGGGLGGVAIALIIVGVLFVIGLGVGWACRRPSPSSYGALPTRPGPAAQHPPPPGAQAYMGGGGGVPPPQQPQWQGAAPGYGPPPPAYGGYAPPAGAYDAPKV